MCTRDHGRSAPYGLMPPQLILKTTKLSRRITLTLFSMSAIYLYFKSLESTTRQQLHSTANPGPGMTQRTLFFCQGHQKVEELCSEYNSLQKIYNTISHPNASKRYLRVQFSLTFTTGFFFCHLQKRLQAGTLQN